MHQNIWIDISIASSYHPKIKRDVINQRKNTKRTKKSRKVVHRLQKPMQAKQDRSNVTIYKKKKKKGKF